MPDVIIKVMSMNPKRECSIEIKGLNPEQLPEYVTKTYRDLIDLMGASDFTIDVDDESKSQLLVEKKIILEDEYQDHIGSVVKNG